MPLLADWYVQISTRGLPEVSEKILTVEQKLAKAEAASKKFEQSISTAFTIATVGITAFVKAGLSGTDEGAKFDAQWQLLSQTIAGIFLPAIEGVGDAVQKLAEVFDSFGDTGQTAILAVAAAVAVLMAVMTGGLLPIITAVVAGLGLITKLSEDPSKSRDKGAGRVTPTQQAKLEKPEDIFNRIQLAVAGGTTADKQLKVMESQLAEQRETNKRLAQGKPAVA